MPYIQRKSGSLRVPGLDGDDLVQEGIIGLFHALKTYDKGRGATFSHYARRCIDNRLISAWRQATRRKNAPLNNSLPIDDAQAENADAGGCPEEIAIAAEQYEALLRRVQSLLSPFERTVLKLHLQGYDYKTSARRTGATPKAVDNALQRARRKLRSG